VTSSWNDYGLYLDTVTNTNLTAIISNDNTYDGTGLTSSDHNVLRDAVSLRNDDTVSTTQAATTTACITSLRMRTA